MSMKHGTTLTRRPFYTEGDIGGGSEAPTPCLLVRRMSLDAMFFAASAQLSKGHRNVFRLAAII